MNKFNILLDGVGIDIMTEDVGGSRIRYIFNRKLLEQRMIMNRSIQRENGRIRICQRSTRERQNEQIDDVMNRYIE